MGMPFASVDAFFGKKKIRTRLGAGICATSFFASLVISPLAGLGRLGEGPLWSDLALCSLGVSVFTALLLDSYFTLGLLVCVASPFTFGFAGSFVAGLAYFVAVLAFGAACMVRSFRWHAVRTAVRLASDCAAERAWVRNLVAWEWAGVSAVIFAVVAMCSLEQLAHVAPDRWQELSLFSVMAEMIGFTSWLLLLLPLLAIGSDHGWLAAALGRCAVVGVSLMLTDLAAALQQVNLKPGAGASFLCLFESMRTPFVLWGVWFAADAVRQALRVRDRKTLLLLTCFASFCAASAGFVFSCHRLLK